MLVVDSEGAEREFLMNILFRLYARMQLSKAGRRTLTSSHQQPHEHAQPRGWCLAGGWRRRAAVTTSSRTWVIIASPPREKVRDRVQHFPALSTHRRPHLFLSHKNKAPTRRLEHLLRILSQCVNNAVPTMHEKEVESERQKMGHKKGIRR